MPRLQIANVILFHFLQTLARRCLALTNQVGMRPASCAAWRTDASPSSAKEAVSIYPDIDYRKDREESVFIRPTLDAFRKSGGRVLWCGESRLADESRGPLGRGTTFLPPLLRRMIRTLASHKRSFSTDSTRESKIRGLVAVSTIEANEGAHSTPESWNGRLSKRFQPVE